jgi:predicted restriction endonuclease
MNEKRYKKKVELQQKLISRQAEQIDDLKSQVEALKIECTEKDNIINSVSVLKEELTQNVSDAKKYKNEFRELVQELRKMKDIINQEAYNGRWSIIKLLIK